MEEEKTTVPEEEGKKTEEAPGTAGEKAEGAEKTETSGEPEEKTAESAGKEEGGKEEAKDPAEEAKAKIAELTDRLQRQMAEFENFRKRTDKEKSAMFDLGSRNVIEKILPVIDNFERGLAGVPEESKEDPFVTGMERVYRQLMTELEALGVKVIEAKGQPFNPDLHNAVMHVEDDTIDENTVVEEFQKGYTFHDSIVRYSMVKVAN